MMRLEVGNDQQVLAIYLIEVHSLHVHKPHQRCDRCWHFAPGLITRAAALGDTDGLPKVFLPESKRFSQVSWIGEALQHSGSLLAHSLLRTLLFRLAIAEHLAQ